MEYLDNFHYQITGNPQGHKLVFLHGLMGSAANWMRVTPAFHADFHILTLDQRGHGRSFHPENGYRPRDYAEDLRKILDQLGWDQLALVGHSMGGRNALEFAADFSQRVKVLVLEDIGPSSSQEAMERITKLVDLVPTPFSTRDEAKEFFANEYPRRVAYTTDPQVLSRFFYSNIEGKPDGTQDWRFAKNAIFKSLQEGRKEDRWDQFAALKMPVLVIRGANSVDLPRPIFDRMLKALPAARGVEIANSGHWVHFEQLDAFVRTLKEFFHATLGTNL